MSEGLQYLLLTRAGELLQPLVLHQHGGTPAEHAAQGRTSTEEERRAAATEARLLTPLIKRACNPSLAPASSEALPDTGRNGLSGSARHKLLATLTRSCLGGDAATLILGEESRGSALEKHDAARELETLLAEVDADVEAGCLGFLGEMWELFGWDVLVE